MTVALVRCGRCDHRTRIHRFPRSWARYKGGACVPVSLEEFETTLEQQTTRERRLMFWIFSGLAGLMGLAFWIVGMAPDTNNRWLAFAVAVPLLATAVFLGLAAIRAGSR